MNSSELTKAIKHLKPTAEFSFIDNDYSTIKWDILEGEAPTIKELESALVEITKQETATEAQKQAAKTALLDRLGITESEAKLLLA